MLQLRLAIVLVLMGATPLVAYAADELCHNGRDDDNNGSFDCEDDACTADQICVAAKAKATEAAAVAASRKEAQKLRPTLVQVAREELVSARTDLEAAGDDAQKIGEAVLREREAIRALRELGAFSVPKPPVTPPSAAATPASGPAPASTASSAPAAPASTASAVPPPAPASAALRRVNFTGP